MAGAGQHRRDDAQHGKSGPGRPASPLPRVVRHLRSGLTVRMAEVLGRTRVTVCGEIDLDCAETLHQALVECVAATPQGVDVDLSGVGFFDCAGLNVLLRVRALAQATGAELTVAATSPVVARVLDLTHCRDAFPRGAPPACAPAAAPWPASRPA
ncbi:STAS domain-containing protein [Streptomyces sp. NPDC020983]|uniref:STAS domain-containing protein n=1 Tax=Streptomyces sp. NPDC020983 TaxID=3365106 RepID=UPI003796F446